jgi:HAE1 family hydrophobic/amphiphilic exporter-1
VSVAAFSIRRPVTTVMFFVSLFAIGLIAATRLSLEAFPAANFPVIFAQLPYPGSTPEEVERSILRPAEEALATMPGIKNIQSTATGDSASIAVFFSDWERDVAIAASEARERIDAIRGDLPDDMQRYFVGNFDTTDQPVIAVRLASKSLQLDQAYELIDRQFKRRLERLPGVARVEVSGATPSEVEIAISSEALSAYGLSLNELASRLREANFTLSAGKIDDGSQRVRVQPVGEIQDLDQLRDLVVGQNGLRLRDVAEVRLKPVRMDYGRRLDGFPAVGIDVFKERNANLVEVSRLAKEEVERIRESPALRDIQVKIINDQGETVTGSLMELAEAGLIGLLLSIIVLYFFLRHWPSTLMVTLAIPICFIMTLGFMYFAGITLNILSMMGLLLAVGMLVDNAVVVVESIYQEREKNPDNPLLASLLGTRHVAIALSAGTLCHCIVFVPNLFGERNLLAIYLSQIAVTISVSLLASWLVAISLIPMISARLKTPPTLRDSTGMINRLQLRYARLLRWTLEHRGKSVLGILLITLISIVPMVMTKTNMFGGDDGLETAVEYQWNSGYTKEQMSEEVRRIEDYLERNRERFKIVQIYSWYGEGGGRGGAQTRIAFDEDFDGDVKTLIDDIRKGLPNSARAKLTIGQADDQGSAPKTVEVQLTGDSTQVLVEIAEDVLPMLSRIETLRDVRINTGDKNTELRVRVDRERAAAFGFSAQEVSSFVGIALRGTQLRDFRRGDTEVAVWARFGGAERFRVQDLESFSVLSRDGRSVPLLSLVDVSVVPSANNIQRINRQTSITIEATPAGETTVPEAREAVEKALKSVAFPAGYGYSFESVRFFDESEMVAQMMFNLLIALVMIYVVMAAVFESLLFPVAIMSGVLFSVFGVFWLFWATGTEFNIMAFIGILVLMGVVVNNGIVMIEHINNLRRRGLDRTEALVEGSRERLRPILMTMGTAILAMIPIALSTPNSGNELSYYPMARAIAGGLAFSTLVSLLFLPTIYAVLDDLRAATSRIIADARRGGRIAPAAAAAGGE